ncbi:MAG: hypothetical protein Q9220_006311 [cf. Caloplaca sp. 1 TL-2023]
MPFQILPAEPSDIPEIAVIQHEAFKDDPIIGRLWPDVDRQVKHEYDIKLLQRHFAQKELLGSVFHKLVDTENGKIVAFSKWKYGYTLTPEQQAEKEKLDTKRFHPPGSNETLYNDFFSQLDARRKKYCGDDKDYFSQLTTIIVLHILMVIPDYQRRGLGAMLIREGLAAADRDEAKCYIEASPAGLELYKRYGWKQVDEIVLDMKPHGGSGMATEVLLIREPGAGIPL